MKRLINLTFCFILLSTTGVVASSSTTSSNSIFTKAEIAKYAIASIMNKNPDKIKVKKEASIYKVYYLNDSRSNYINYKIKFNGNQIIWGNYDGRWRDTNYDEKIYYEESDNGTLKIIQKFRDGSSINDEFQK